MSESSAVVRCLAMKLYVCYGTFIPPLGPAGTPAEWPTRLLTEAGHEPEVIKSYGWGILPDFLNPSSGRREVRKLTGSNTVPVLVTDDGEVIQESREIKRWAEAHPATAPAG